MDERIREILRAIEKWTCGKREDKPLTHLRPNIGMGEGGGGENGKTKGGGGGGENGKTKGGGGFKEESLREERLHLLSKFLRNRNRGFKRSKRKSSTSRQGLRIETGVGEF